MRDVWEDKILVQSFFVLPSYCDSYLIPLSSQTSELEQLRLKLTKSMREKFRHEAEIATLSAYVVDFNSTPFLPARRLLQSLVWAGLIRNPGG